jgi:nucleotide-binding universal stress UspA family protein
MFKHILVALDGSDCSHQALDLAVKLAKEQGARCTVCAVVDIVRAASSMTFAQGDIVNQWIATLKEDAREIEAQAIQRLWLGSVAESVVREAPVPVLIVR